MATTMTHIVVALLVRDGRALLVHRSPGRLAYPDCWGLAGGHVEPGEVPSEAISRECLEELGTQICRPRHISMTVADPNLKMHGFLVTRWTAEPINAAPEEHDDMRWFLPSEIANLTLAPPECLPDILKAISFAANDRMSDKGDPSF